MISGFALALLLTAARPASLAETRAELDAIATRIEQLKARQLEGDDVRRELVRLLVRAQELAGSIESSLALDGPVPTASVPSAEELRERADAARDEADRLAVAVHAVDMRISAIRRGRVPLGVTLTSAPREDRELALRQLVAERAELTRRMHVALAEAARLDGEADAIETEPRPGRPRR